MQRDASLSDRLSDFISVWYGPNLKPEYFRNNLHTVAVSSALFLYANLKDARKNRLSRRHLFLS